MKQIGPVHFLGIGGLAMAGLASELRRLGWKVTGSDQAIYGHAAKQLSNAGLIPTIPCATENLPHDIRLVIVGTSTRQENPELIEARNRGLPCLTFPEFLAQWFSADCQCVQIAGTNGKSSTTAMLMHLLRQCGGEFSYLVGASSGDIQQTVNLSSTKLAVLEADESRCARWLTLPKFHVLPCTSLVLTSFAPDHPESFADDAAYAQAFRERIESLPAEGFLVGHSRNYAHLGSPATPARLCLLENAEKKSQSGFFHALGDGGFYLDGQFHKLSVPGRHMAANAALAVRAMQELGRASAGASLSTYTPLVERLQTLAEDPIRVVLDRGYHPESIRVNLQTLREMHPGTRWMLLIQPRYLSASVRYIDSQLPLVLAGADDVFVFPEEILTKPVPPEEDFKSHSIVRAINEAGGHAHYVRDVGAVWRLMMPMVQPGYGLFIVLPGKHQRAWEFLLEKLNASQQSAATLEHAP